MTLSTSARATAFFGFFCNCKNHVDKEDLLAGTCSIAPGNSLGRSTRAVFLLLVLIPCIFTAVTLLPELSISIPSLNDDAFHFILIQRGSEALANGENLFDHWTPELDVGFPQFLYYQHLPHLTVILLHRLLLKQVDLLTLFNMIRYLLLVCFPITVFWSMRKMGFSTVAGAVAASFSTLLSSQYGYGLESGSYIWRGWGLYTQLWAVHLSFIALACLYHLIEEGKGYAAAVTTCSLLVLSHLVYSYMVAIAAIVLFLSGLDKENIRQRLGRYVTVAAPVVAVTSYFWVPFLIYKGYMGVSPYEPAWKYNSFGALDIITRLVNGDLLDHNRLPVLTLLLGLGVVFAVMNRPRPARLALLLFLVWLSVFFGRHTWGRLADLLPMSDRLHFHRFIGGVHIAGILLIGLGGEWVWRLLAPLRQQWRNLAVGIILLGIMIPALWERQGYHSLNKQWMEQAKRALDGDQDARTILSTLAGMPPGRAYAGRRDNWGKEQRIGNLYFFDLLTFHRVVAITPYESFSLNADLIWHIDDRNRAYYNLFNVRYVVASSHRAMPSFLRPIKTTPRYTLYEAESGGYAKFITIHRIKKVSSQLSLFNFNRNWMTHTNLEEGKFIRYDYPARSDGAEGSATGSHSGGGSITEEKVLPGRMDLRVHCQEAATLALKMTYHPNWKITIDGQKVQTFMVSPSFIGFEIPAGTHSVRAEYRSPVYKSILLILGACILGVTIWFRRLFSSVDAHISARS